MCCCSRLLTNHNNPFYSDQNPTRFNSHMTRARRGFGSFCSSGIHTPGFSVERCSRTAYLVSLD